MYPKLTKNNHSLALFSGYLIGSGFKLKSNIKSDKTVSLYLLPSLPTTDQVDPPSRSKASLYFTGVVSGIPNTPNIDHASGL